MVAFDKDGGGRDRKTRTCLMNILKVGESGLVSLHCPKPFDGSQHCSPEGKAPVQSALPSRSASSPTPRGIPTASPGRSLTHKLCSSVPSAQNHLPRDVWTASRFSPSTLFLLKCFSAKSSVTMDSETACPHPSNSYKSFCLFVFLDNFYLPSCCIA